MEPKNLNLIIFLGIIMTFLDLEKNRIKQALAKFTISPLLLSILLSLILSGLLVNDMQCYKSAKCLPSKTTYRVQFIVLLSHLTSIGLVLFALIHATELNLKVQITLAKIAGVYNLVLFVLRTVIELVYINYHPEDYVKD